MILGRGNTMALAPWIWWVGQVFEQERYVRQKYEAGRSKGVVVDEFLPEIVLVWWTYKNKNVGKTIINHPWLGMVYTTCLWWNWGLFMIVYPR
jgi:hypothetical protein